MSIVCGEGRRAQGVWQELEESDARLGPVETPLQASAVRSRGEREH